jgi:diaminopimelate decarboxylase
MQTGLTDSKFGLPIATGDALAAVREALAAPGLDLRGYHAHVGSNAQEPDAIAEGARQLLAFARTARDATGYWPAELSPGGGLGIAYARGERPPDPYALAQAVFVALAGAAPMPAVSVEPGRSIVCRAGVALYTAGAQKVIPGVRHYVAVDGGMADNIRPALYGARYTPLAATRLHEPAAGLVTVAGRYCESGDVLARDVALPALQAGDLLAFPGAGAYCLPMSSAYNAAPRPAVVVVANGAARLVQRRGTLDDLLAYEV